MLAHLKIISDIAKITPARLPKSGKLYNFFGRQKRRFDTFDDFGVRNDQKVYT